MRVTRTMVLVGASIAALWVLWQLFPLRAEKGIRVKNGSVTVETPEGLGFVVSIGRRHLRNREGVQGCYRVQVLNTSCTGDDTADNVKRLQFKRGDNAYEDGEDGQVLNLWPKRFFITRSDGWELKQDPKNQEINQAVFANADLAHVYGYDPGGRLVLDCRNNETAPEPRSDDDRFQAFLTPTQCR